LRALSETRLVCTLCYARAITYASVAVVLTVLPCVFFRTKTTVAKKRKQKKSSKSNGSAAEDSKAKTVPTADAHAKAWPF
jgi:hypothetical protein